MLPKLFVVTIIALLITNMGLAQSPPAGFVPPPLNPKGVMLKAIPLGLNVYALESSRPPVDNAGFVVGEKGVLVIDSHINGEMGKQIIEAVRSVTDKPILYLVNTNGHADHTFGNYVFPPETIIIAQKLTKVMMSPPIEELKTRNLVLVGGDKNAFDGVEKRMPNLTFDKFMEIDLGGITVELHYFGAGNTFGDTVVYVPSVKAAWTGNLIFGDGSIPFLLLGNTEAYINTLNAFQKAFDLNIIIPGHGIPARPAIFDRYVDYLKTLEEAVEQAIEKNLTLEETLKSVTLEKRFMIPENLSSHDFYAGLHPFNVQKIYLEKNVR
ncbi:MAG: MBL fold metallo-hydrolase [Emcibacteraceae bacterium]